MRGSRGGQGVWTPLENHERIQEFLSGGGVQVSLTKKNSDNVFFFFFFSVLSLFYRSQNGSDLGPNCLHRLSVDVFKNTYRMCANAFFKRPCVVTQICGVLLSRSITKCFIIFFNKNTLQQPLKRNGLV